MSSLRSILDMPLIGRWLTFLAVEALVHAQAIPGWILGGKCGTGTDFSRSIFPCQYHYTYARYSQHTSYGEWPKSPLKIHFRRDIVTPHHNHDNASAFTVSSLHWGWCNKSTSTKYRGKERGNFLRLKLPQNL